MSSSSSSSSNSSSSASEAEQHETMSSQVSLNIFSENQDNMDSASVNLGFNYLLQNNNYGEEDGIDLMDDSESLEVPYDLQVDPPFPEVSYVEPVDKEIVPPPAKKAKLDEDNVEFEVSSAMTLQLRKWIFSWI